MWCFSGTAAYDPHSRVWCRKLHMARVAGASEAQRSSISITAQQSKANSQEERKKGQPNQASRMRGVRPSRRVPLMTIVWRRTVGVQQPAPGFGRINTLTWRGARCFLRCFSCFVLSFPLLFPLLSVCASDRPALGQLFPKRKDARRSCLNPSVKGTTATALRASQVSHRTAQPSIVPFFSLFILLLLPRRTGEALMVYVKHLRAHDALWKKRIAFAPKTFVVLL